MKAFSFIASLLLLFLVSCKKESPPDNPTPPPIDTIPAYVPVYQPGDTSRGACYAKKLTANWKAEAISRVQSYFDTNYVGITFLTYSNHWEQRESLGFGFIPRFGGNKTYLLKNISSDELPVEFIDPFYETWKSDGDVPEDHYVLDTTATDNRFTVVSIDHVNKRIECTFTATFKITEPRKNPVNPKIVKFSEGRAWAFIKD